MGPVLGENKMIYNDKWWLNNPANIQPFDEKRINPASYDLSWSGRYRPYANASRRTGKVIHSWDKQDVNESWESVRESDTLHIFPGELYLLDTLETMEIPTDAAGFLFLKSSLARCGLEHLHAGFFDPGFGLGKPSTGTLEVFNASPVYIIVIRKGQPIVQLILMDCEPPMKDYRVTGSYNGQTEPKA